MVSEAAAGTADTTTAAGTQGNRIEDALARMDVGKRARLRRLLYRYGPANGSALILPYDQGLEHGPRDFFDNPDSVDPAYVFRLAREGRFSAMAVQIGIARKYARDLQGTVPLIIKLNGKTEVPPGDVPFSRLNALVDEAAALGAEAVGYTIYVGNARQDEDLRQFAEVRRAAEAAGMPVIAYAYPRGKDAEKKGGEYSPWAIEYAARAAAEVGADIVKLTFPQFDAAKTALSPKPYGTLGATPSDPTGMMQGVVRAAGRTLVLLSGGNRDTEESTLEHARIALDAGVMGLIFGRNIWQRPYPDALALVNRLHALLDARPR